MAVFPQPKYQRFGKYVLLDRINVGGMAEVFRGKQFGVEGFSRLVALKRILPNIAKEEEFIEMFVDEAKLTVQLQHANIVQTYDLGLIDERYFIAMEYVSGTDLRTVWDRARRRNRLLPIAMSCYLVMKCCEGLDYAHRKKDEAARELGLVHRDVSPQNLLVSYEGEVKLVDFGIALVRQKVSKSQAGVLKGKFGYMSPEQVRGHELDQRSDLFACGTMLWELLVGDRLFLGESDFSTLEKVRNVEMVPPTHFNKSLSPQIERIVMKALAKNRDDRYRYASEMAEDLQRFLFTSNQPFARTDLQRYMAQHFAEEMQAEQERLERYAQLKEADFSGPEKTSVEGVAADAPQVGPQIALRAPGTYDPVALQEPSPRAPTALRPRPMSLPGGLLDGTGATPPPSLGGIASNAGVPLGRIGAATVPTPRTVPPPAKGGMGRLFALGLALAGLAAAIVVAVVWVTGQAEPGTLEVSVRPPDAVVTINDRPMAKNPADLAPGTYVLSVKRPGYKDFVRAVTIGAGQMAVETVMLEATAGTASVIVHAKPDGLAIWLDGRDTNLLTPATVAPLQAGPHALELKQDGQALYKTTVELRDNAAETLEVDLTRLPPVLEVVAEPDGADVFVNGKRVGVTPLRLDTLAPGAIKVEIKRAKCTSIVQDVELKPAATRKLAIKLRCS